MKNNKLVFLAIIIIATSMSCKNDLFKTSVKKRLTNEWVLIEGTQSLKDTVFPRDEIYSKDSVEIRFHDGTSTFAYFETLEFKKDYTYTSTQGYDYYNGFETYTIDGIWEIMPAGDGYEDDERIRLIPKTKTETSPDGTTETTSYNENYKYTYILEITKITKDELNFNFAFTEDTYDNYKRKGNKKFVEK